MTRSRTLATSITALCAAALLACSAQHAEDVPAADDDEGATDMEHGHNRLTAEERDAGWRLLFDGETTTGWRGYRRDDVPDGWQVVDGTLARVADAGDIITTDTFRDFELTLEWMVEPGGNSGIFYRAIEGDAAIYTYAPEMQVLDDELHHDGQDPLTSAGALYGLYPAPRGVVRPAGEWNSVRIRVQGNAVTHWLNGTRIVDAEMGSPEWEQRIAGTKFADWPDFGRAAEGHIGLQDHDDLVWFRNIKIRPLQ